MSCFEELECVATIQQTLEKVSNQFDQPYLSGTFVPAYPTCLPPRLAPRTLTLDRFTSSPRKKAIFFSRVATWMFSRLGTDTTSFAVPRRSRPSVVLIHPSFGLMLPSMLSLRIAGALETILPRVWSSRSSSFCSQSSLGSRCSLARYLRTCVLSAGPGRAGQGRESNRPGQVMVSRVSFLRLTCGRGGVVTRGETERTAQVAEAG